MRVFGDGPTDVADAVRSLPGDATVLILAGEPADHNGAEAPVSVLFSALRGRPERVVVLDLGGPGELAAVRSALIGTAVRYATGELFAERVAVNVVRATGSDVQAAVSAVGALSSGLLDAVRGQTLEVRS